ncbi:hypothetical protein KFK09_016877 [Dendrobium nobile]|uniref:Uncharacterized protein n=1 Tax=Dendrobium nobile TaxID=94219 RepID=A0A8T3B1V6_DENNO|nr:hypothetical protein KFK09_016877 [Dendrobium nobile]
MGRKLTGTQGWLSLELQLVKVFISKTILGSHSVINSEHCNLYVLDALSSFVAVFLDAYIASTLSNVSCYILIIKALFPKSPNFAINQKYHFDDVTSCISCFVQFGLVRAIDCCSTKTLN